MPRDSRFAKLVFLAAGIYGVTVEKLSFGLAAAVLYGAGRTAGAVAAAGAVDLVLAVLAAFRDTRNPGP